MKKKNHYDDMFSLNDIRTISLHELIYFYVDSKTNNPNCSFCDDAHVRTLELLGDLDEEIDEYIDRNKL